LDNLEVLSQGAHLNQYRGDHGRATKS
jgi:hypothetical protein